MFKYTEPLLRAFQKSVVQHIRYLFDLLFRFCGKLQNFYCTSGQNVRKLARTALPNAKQISHSPHLKVSLRDFESVAAVEHCNDSFFRALRRLGAQQIAVGLIRASSDASAQLMQRSEPEICAW